MFIIEIGTKRCTMACNIMPLSVFDVARNLDFFSKRQSLRYLTTLGPSLQGGNITATATAATATSMLTAPMDDETMTKRLQTYFFLVSMIGIDNKAYYAKC